MLGMVWQLQEHGREAYAVREHVLPGDLSALKAGYVEEETTSKASAAEADPLALSGAMETRIAQIKTQIARMELIKKPDAVLSAYAQHVCGAIPRDQFTQTPERYNQPERDEETISCSTKWGDAVAIEGKHPDDLAACKPTEIRMLLAKKMLDCLTRGQVLHTTDAKTLHAYFKPDETFWKGFKKPQLVHMLTDNAEKAADLAKWKKGALEGLATQHYDRDVGFLPLGS